MAMLHRVISKLSDALLIIAGVVLVLMLVNVVADIGGKYVFSQPVPGTIQIVSWYYMPAAVFLPIAYVQLRREHLMVELFTMQLSERKRAAIDGFAAIGGVVYVGLLTWLVYLEAVASTARNEVQDITYIDMEVWPARWILPVAFGLMAVVMLVQAIDDLRFAASGKGPRIFVRERHDEIEDLQEV